MVRSCFEQYDGEVFVDNLQRFWLAFDGHGLGRLTLMHRILDDMRLMAAFKCTEISRSFQAISDILPNSSASFCCASFLLLCMSSTLTFYLCSTVSYISRLIFVFLSLALL